jgi:hypothetical protein
MGFVEEAGARIAPRYYHQTASWRIVLQLSLYPDPSTMY